VGVVSLAIVATMVVATFSASSATAGPSRVVGDSTSEWVESTLSRMTLEEKIGQLFVPRIYGTTADTRDPDAVTQNRAEFGVDNAVGLVERYDVGGLIYFAANITTPRALATFGNRVQAVAATEGVPVPVLTAIDQEQGQVVRVGPPATMFPGSMALGASRSVEDAWQAARITGVELRAMGVLQDYAPVADVNVNPANPVIGVRSFASNQGLVSRLVRVQVDGYQAAGVAATAKHFPGHGDTGTDSHTDLPVITHSAEQVARIDLRPFEAAIDAGVDSIMTAHIVVPAVDGSGLPSTLSRTILTGLLRERLGYDGVIVTDSLRMQGVRTMFPDGEVAVRAIEAGADQLLDPPNLPVAFEAVLDAAVSGRLPSQRIDDSVRRILQMKHTRGFTTVQAVSVDPALVDAVVGAPAHQAVAQRVTDATTTLVRDVDDLLPLRGWRGKRVLVTGRGAATTDALATSLRQRGAVVTVVETGTQPTSESVASAVAASQGQDLVVALTYNVGVNQQQVELVRALSAAGPALVVAAVGTPYDIAWFPSIPTYLATYSTRPVALESLARVLSGQAVPIGRLPVAVPRVKAPGGDLYPFGWRMETG
jgi:beta-N-acetylhexosaminidase